MIATLCMTALLSQLFYGTKPGSPNAQPNIPSSHTGELMIVEPEMKLIPLYGKFEARIKADARYTNPFDPGEMDFILGRKAKQHLKAGQGITLKDIQ